MTDKELRRLSRMELIQLLLEQAKELERVQRELEEARGELESREITLSKVGSIAEASLELNHVMEAAQQAADQYMENIKAEYTRRAREQYEAYVARLRIREESANAQYGARLREAQRGPVGHGGDK